MSAKIGSGIAKKAAWREQRSIDEAIASGMVSRKAIAEKKRREIKKERGGQGRGAAPPMRPPVAGRGSAAGGPPIEGGCLYWIGRG